MKERRMMVDAKSAVDDFEHRLDMQNDCEVCEQGTPRGDLDFLFAELAEARNLLNEVVGPETITRKSTSPRFSQQLTEGKSYKASSYATRVKVKRPHGSHATITVSGSDAVQTLFDELGDARNLLHDVTSRSKSALRNPEPKMLSDDEIRKRQENSSSAWAKSRSSGYFKQKAKYAAGASSSSGKVEQTPPAQSFVRQRAPEKGFTFAKEHIAHDVLAPKTAADHIGPCAYDVKVDYSSKRERGRRPFISSTPRFIGRKESNDSGDGINTANRRTVEAPDVEVEVNDDDDDIFVDTDTLYDETDYSISHHRSESKQHQKRRKRSLSYDNAKAQVAGKAYSFGKAPRHGDRKSHIDVNSDDLMPLNVEAAKDALKPRSQGVILGPSGMEKHTARQLQQDEVGEGHRGSDDSDDVGPEEDIHIYEPIVPQRYKIHGNVTMRPDSRKTEKQLLLALKKRMEKVGPGHYRVEGAADQMSKRSARLRSCSGGVGLGLGLGLVSGDGRIGSDVGIREVRGGVQRVGKVYHEPTRLSASAVRALAVSRSYQRGPGEYDVTAADKATKVTQPMTSMRPASEAKLTPQLERKRYWEEKARDAREAFDDMRIPSDSALRAEVRSARIYGEGRASDGETKASPHVSKGKPNRQKTELECLLDEFVADDRLDDPGFRDIKYDYIERGPRSAVNMSAEIDARRSTQEKVYTKVGVVKAINDKAVAEQARDVFYGPQLQVPWAGDGNRSEVPDKNKSGDHASPDTSFLIPRQPAGNAEGNPNGASATASAFLRSSHSRSAAERSSHVMRSPKPHEERNFDLRAKEKEREAKKRNFLSNQLPVDWTSDKPAPDLRVKAPSYRMDANRGRESVKVHRKGIVDVVQFDEVRQTDKFGPGAYETDYGYDIGSQGTGVAFHKLVSRDDAIGPHGQKPQNAVKPYAEVAEDSYYADEMLDIDYAEAKDDAEQKRDYTRPLYGRERFEEKDLDDPALDHLGGSWFEGMADEALKRRPAVDMSRQQGRTVDRDEEGLVNDEVDAYGELDLEVKDWKPHKERVITYSIRDPIKHPRFEPVSDDEYHDREDLSPNYEYVKSRPVAAVDMSKQAGRVDSQDKRNEEDMIVTDTEGHVERADVVKITQERDAKMAIGAEMVSGMARLDKGFVDMNRQTREVSAKEKDEVYLDHLGGSYFEGMAEAALKRNQSVDMSKQIGRIDDGDELKMIEGDLDAQEELDLDVQDWKPHMERVISHPILDPNKHPRFKESKDVDEREPLSPNHDVKFQRDKMFVRMDAQTDRKFPTADIEEDDFVGREMNGDADAEMAKGIAQDRDAKYVAGQEMTTRLGRTGKGAVSMSGHSSRKELHDTRSNDIEQTESQYKKLYGSTLGKNRHASGAGNWSKTNVSRNPAIDDTIMEGIAPSEPLELSPSDEPLKRFPTVGTGPAWVSPKRSKAADKVALSSDFADAYSSFGRQSQERAKTSADADYGEAATGNTQVSGRSQNDASGKASGRTGSRGAAVEDAAKQQPTGIVTKKAQAASVDRLYRSGNAKRQTASSADPSRDQSTEQAQSHISLSRKQPAGSSAGAIAGAGAGTDVEAYKKPANRPKISTSVRSTSKKSVKNVSRSGAKTSSATASKVALDDSDDFDFLFEENEKNEISSVTSGKASKIKPSATGSANTAPAGNGARSSSASVVNAASGVRKDRPSVAGSTATSSKSHLNTDGSRGAQKNQTQKQTQNQTQKQTQKQTQGRGERSGQGSGLGASRSSGAKVGTSSASRGAKTSSQSKGSTDKRKSNSQANLDVSDDYDFLFNDASEGVSGGEVVSRGGGAGEGKERGRSKAGFDSAAPSTKPLQTNPAQDGRSTAIGARGGASSSDKNLNKNSSDDFDFLFEETSSGKRASAASRGSGADRGSASGGGRDGASGGGRGGAVGGGGAAGKAYPRNDSDDYDFLFTDTQSNSREQAEAKAAVSEAGRESRGESRRQAASPAYAYGGNDDVDRVEDSFNDLQLGVPKPISPKPQ